MTIERKDYFYLGRGHSVAWGNGGQSGWRHLYQDPENRGNADNEPLDGEIYAAFIAKLGLGTDLAPSVEEARMMPPELFFERVSAQTA